MKQKLVVLVDFDNTASTGDVGLSLVETFARDDSWRIIDNDYLKGRIGSRQAYQKLQTLMEGDEREWLKFCFEKYRLPKVNISVFSHNIPALVLYSRLGFTPIELEERQDFSGQKTVMIHMTLPRKIYEDGTNKKGHGR